MKNLLAAAALTALSAGAAQAAVFDINATFAGGADGVTTISGTVGWDAGTASFTPQDIFNGHTYDPATLSLTSNIGAITGSGLARVEDATPTNGFAHDAVEFIITSITGASWIGVTIRLEATGETEVLSDHTDEHLLAIDPASWTVQSVVVTNSGFGSSDTESASIEYEYTGGEAEVPLPAAAPLALAGLAALGFAGRRRRG